MKKNRNVLLVVFNLFILSVFSQNNTSNINILLIDSLTKESIYGATIFTSINDENFQADELENFYHFNNLYTKNTYLIKIQSFGYISETLNIYLNNDTTITIELSLLNNELNDIVISDSISKISSKSKIYDVEGVSLYAGRKTEKLLLSTETINKSLNKGRQTYSKFSGLNIWESDNSGLQLDVGSRGLNPSRTSNFNTKQNGYDIAADALGYPESYYTPPTEGVEKIEMVRGAASLQYGTQFGGMINYTMKKGDEDKPFNASLRQTVGSYGYFGTFVSVGGTINKNLNYYSFYNYKTGKGYRDNTQFQSQNYYISFQYHLNKRINIKVDYSMLDYLAQQPGGLTDNMFIENPKQSTRARNWFKINWNIIGLNFDYKINDKNTINSRFFNIIASRKAVGVLTRPDRSDNGRDRNLITGDFLNFGNETRWLHRYKIKHINSVLLTGFRLYSGQTNNFEGWGSNGSDANFNFSDFEGNTSNYKFPIKNIALFSENIFYLNKKISITPGLRYEYIETGTKGDYTEVTSHPTNPNDVLSKDTIYKSSNSIRKIFLAGISLSYKPNEIIEFYGNLSQNYRAITFNELSIQNKNLIIDDNLQDETGITTDIGIRGTHKDFFNYDFSFFYIKYGNRIGEVYEANPITLQSYRYRTNIGNSNSLGFEFYGEIELFKLFNVKYKGSSLMFYNNIAFTDAYYYNTIKPEIENNIVESAPKLTYRGGLTYNIKKLKINTQFSYVSNQYSDATNSESSSSTGGVVGEIPSYYVIDLNTSYIHKKLSIEAGVNNLSNNSYFTRRATGYPGPGIIPADPRTYYVTIGYRFK